MEPTYILIKIRIDGTVQAGMTTNPIVPKDFVKPGEVAFTINPVDFNARHSHEA